MFSGIEKSTHTLNKNIDFFSPSKLIYRSTLILRLSNSFISIKYTQCHKCNSTFTIAMLNIYEKPRENALYITQRKARRTMISNAISLEKPDCHFLKRYRSDWRSIMAVVVSYRFLETTKSKQMSTVNFCR